MPQNEASNQNIEVTTKDSDPFRDPPPTPTTQITTTKHNKDIILGKLMKQVRQSGDSLLFAMLTNIKRYEMEDNAFVVVCDHIVNYQDLIATKNLEILIKYIQNIDCNLTFRVKLEEDRTKEIIAENVKTLKETFGKLVKFIE